MVFHMILFYVDAPSSCVCTNTPALALVVKLCTVNDLVL